MNKLTLIAIIVVAIVVAVAIAIAVPMLYKQRATLVQCPGKDNTMFIVYYSIPPNETIFKYLSTSISNVIASNTSGAINITFSICSVRYGDLGENLRADLSNRTVFPIIGIYTSKNIAEAVIARQLFNSYGNYYIVKENLTRGIYAYLAYYGLSVLKEPRAFVEILRPPELFANETPIIGSPNAKYYLVIYEDMHCPYCAKFYAESLPVIENLTRNGTFAIALKNFIIHEEVLPMHRNITAMYLATQNSTAVLEVMKDVYRLINNGVEPSSDDVASIIKNITGYSKFNVDMNVVDRIIEDDFREGQNYGIFGTPGLIIWSREYNRGVVIVGYASAEEILNIARSYMS